MNIIMQIHFPIRVFVPEDGGMSYTEDETENKSPKYTEVKIYIQNEHIALFLWFIL